MPFICSVLKPFGDLSSPEKHVSVATHGKKAKSFVPFFFENLHKYQSESVSVESLLNRHLSVLPFKSYFEPLYKICEIFNRLDFLAENFEQVRAASSSIGLHQQLMATLTDAGCCFSSSSSSSLVQISNTDEQLQINELIIDAVNRLNFFYNIILLINKKLNYSKFRRISNNRNILKAFVFFS